MANNPRKNLKDRLIASRNEQVLGANSAVRVFQLVLDMLDSLPVEFDPTMPYQAGIWAIWQGRLVKSFAPTLAGQSPESHSALWIDNVISDRAQLVEGGPNFPVLRSALVPFVTELINARVGAGGAAPMADTQTAGLVKRATAALIDAGVDDSTYITPKLLVQVVVKIYEDLAGSLYDITAPLIDGQRVALRKDPETGNPIGYNVDPDTLDQIARRGATSDKKGWTDQLIRLDGGLWLKNLPATVNNLPQLLIDASTGVLYIGPPAGTGGGSGGTGSVTFTVDWFNAAAEYITIWQERFYKETTTPLPPIPQLNGGGSTTPTNPGTQTAKVIETYQRFDPTPEVGHVLELRAQNGDFFQLRVIGRDGTNYNGQWNDATRYDGTTALGSYVYYGTNLLPIGKYKVQGQVKGNIDPSAIESKNFDVSQLIGIDDYAIDGDVKPVEGGDGSGNWYQYSLRQKQNDGSYKPYTGNVVFVATIFVSGITLTESGLLEIPDGTIDAPTKFVVRAYNGKNTELEIEIQPKASAPVKLAPITDGRVVFVDGAGRVANWNTKTPIEVKIRAEHPKGTFISESAFSEIGVKKIGGNYDATGATVERPLGYGSTDPGEWYYLITARPIDQATYPGEEYWFPVSFLNINSGSTTPTNPTDPSTPPSSGVTTPWELDLDEAKILKGEWQWIKNDPSAGNGSVLTIYWTVQSINDFEINEYVTALPSNNNWYDFYNQGNYGNGVNAVARYYNVTASNTLRITVRKKGTTATLHTFNLTMPASATSQPRTTFYQAP